ncbi:hypothetical protein BBP40_007643 [Aspergillus hancockii]|nr:hypothetical protein BBP40_007643 [Aspergillus hancockii]
MSYTTLWRRLSPRQVNFVIQTISLVAIFFEGYDQGVMGGVNTSPTYVTEVGIGRPDGTVTDTTHQGGLVSIYCLGCIFGCFTGGWLADRIGRINGLLFGSRFALVGGALQASIQSSDFMLVARVVTGIGTGTLTGVTPVLVSETSSAEHRGGYLGYVFIANYLGISVAYWLSFGLSFINHGYSDFKWRFLLAFQCIPAIILATCTKALPDSPRYRAPVGRNDEARDLLNCIRRHQASQKEIDREYLENVATAQDSKRSSSIQFAKILFSKSGRPGANLGRRAWLCLLLQIMASWTGITAITAYSPVLLGQAGYGEILQNGLAGDLNTIGILGTTISAQIVDRLGRRNCLMLGSAVLFTVELIGTVAFLIPTEIFPSDLRAQGNGFGITGWAIGVGMTTLVNPIMFDNLKSRSYFLLTGLNLIWIPIVYLFYPETCNRSLESIEALFSTPSPFYWEMDCLHGNVVGKRGIEETHGEDIKPAGYDEVYHRGC